MKQKRDHPKNKEKRPKDGSTSFFFLELHRIAARHFIKVEKRVHESRSDPNPSTGTAHTPTPQELDYRRATGEKKNDQRPQDLRSKGEQPGQELLELGYHC